jgi:trk system potassium uptake protein TrkA
MKIAIVGAGKLGIRLAETLLGGNHSITIIDKNEELMQRLNSIMDIMTISGNGKEISLLKEIDIDTYDYLIATTDRDEKNMVIATFAKQLGCNKVMARIRDPEHMNQREFIKNTMNIDYVTNPDLSISMEIYKYLAEKFTLDNGIFSTGPVSMIEFHVSQHKRLIGKQIKDTYAILQDLNIAAVSRNGKIIIPHSETLIKNDDTLYVLGHRKLITDLSKRVLEKGKYTDIHKIMIAGGGKTGLYTEKMLSEFGASVKIIESSKERCQYLSTHLDDVLILHGDATDLDLLEEENLGGMDAFVTATGYDEENLLLALMAKQMKIEDVIAKISRESYADLIESMGIDMALNPVDISVSHMLRFIQGNEKVISSLIIQGQAEMVEVHVNEDMILTDKEISKLDLPDGMIIAAILRGIHVIIPDGSTEIQDNDRVIILSLLSEAIDLEKLLRTKSFRIFG